jgi:hypothetical protein
MPSLIIEGAGALFELFIRRIAIGFFKKILHHLALIVHLQIMCLDTHAPVRIRQYAGATATIACRVFGMT